jgi:four helix bundle protein
MNHKELEVWKRSIDFACTIYQLTKEFPSEEKYGLINQLRRAVVSISSNIAEGCGRNSDKDLIRFLYISLGSILEVDTQLIISQRLGFMNNKNSEFALQELNEIKRMLLGLIKYIKGKQE